MSNQKSDFDETKQQDSSHNVSNHQALHYDPSDLILPKKGCCFHCGDPVPKPPFFTEVLGENRQMCCMGCQLASQSIVEAGLEQYYLDRTEINRTASLPTELERLQAYDHDEIKSQFVYNDDDKSVAELSVNNLRCAACTWLIEARLNELDGVSKCQVNLTNQRMRVIWNEDKLPISQILKAISDIGYVAKPYRQDTHEAMLARTNKTMMIRLGIAALGAMQAMMYAVGMYFGDHSGMLIEQRQFLRWVSLFVSIPVFFYCAVPFFTSAWSAVKARQVNMDVPVSIALIVTFFASLYATLTGVGETYFDSVSMFVFFLLAGRYIEHNARLRAANMANDLVVVEPTIVKKIAHKPDLAVKLIECMQSTNATKPVESASLSVSQFANTKALTHSAITNNFKFGFDSQLMVSLDALSHKIYDSQHRRISSVSAIDADSSSLLEPLKSDKHSNYEKVIANSLEVGDVIVIEAGSEVVADGILCSKTATVSQSLLTGESDLIVKQQGDAIIGGSQNDSQPFIMIITALAENSQIALIDRLMNRALSEKPKIAEQADQWARWFVTRILVLSVLVFAGWYWIDPAQAIWATVAVLVATCPCALSLATPIALTVSTNRLASYGFLTTRGHTIQTLAEISHIAFDKTGTLTYGKPKLLNIENLHEQHTFSRQSTLKVNKFDENSLLSIAAGLEVGSRHPIASALLDAAYQLHLPDITNLIHHQAGGVEATVNGLGEGQRYRLGHVNFAIDADVENEHNGTQSIAPHSEKYLPNLELHQASTSVMLTRLQIDDDNNSFWQPLATFYFDDSIREGMADMINKLKSQNIQTLMLTGDPSPHAVKVANELGVDQMFNGLSPEAKVAHIKTLQADNHVVMMVGDGINDAPVLAAANISTAIAGAADLAQVSSDSVILNGKVGSVYDAKRVADQAQRIIKQNLYWALGYNAVVLFPAAFGYVPPWLAAIGMSISSLFVVLNALRLKRS